MRFLVRLEADLPRDLDSAELDRLNADETARGIELRESGVIEHIWRLEGRRANVGVWSADSRQELDQAIDSLPLRRYVDVVEISVLQQHPVAADAP